MSILLLPITQQRHNFLADLVFGDGAFETAEETEEVGPAVGFGRSETRTTFAGFFAAEVLELLMDPGAVEFRREEFEVVKDIGWEVEVLVSGGSAVADKLFRPYKHSCSDIVVEDGATNVRLSSSDGRDALDLVGY